MDKEKEEASEPEENTITIPREAPVMKRLPKELPIMALRNAALFPGTILPVTVGRKKSRALVKAVMATKGMLVAVSQRNPKDEDPNLEGLHNVGVTAQIVKVMTMAEDNLTVILHGGERVQLLDVTTEEPFLQGHFKKLPPEKLTAEQKERMPALVLALKEAAVELFKLMESAPAEAGVAIRNIDDEEFLINFIAANLDAELTDKINLLCIGNAFDRATELLRLVSSRIQFLQIKEDIQTKARRGIDRQQREYMLQQQMRTIQDELGDSPLGDLVARYRSRAQEKKWPDQVAETFDKELDKFSRLNSNSSEYGVAQNYLETLLELPWDECSKDCLDLQHAEEQLNRDHYGLDKVKERVLEHLAVIKLKGDLKTPILCLYGPPGVGKTSLGKSIAAAIGRKYVRVSLGGLHDESEVRGHRRTYVGAMPGRIIEGIKNAGTSNPVFILDEIDKVGRDYHGDPESALLEVLDPEQNSAFHDNYIDLDYDLSKVMFIATANNIGAVSAPLQDRMELIPVDGYLREEKLEIAKRHLIPKEAANHGLTEQQLALDDEVLGYMIDHHTRESGVRELDKVIAHLCRKIALKVAKNEALPDHLSVEFVHEMLGKEPYDHDLWSDDLRAGVVTGLAWTAVGGEILFVECAASRGKGAVATTGNLGDVMKESAVLALEYVRSNAKLFGLETIDFDQTNVHIHVPEGAVPKDGPSAGVTMVTAIVSALTGRCVRKRVAMTGEITLRGKVIPVGGITEKILAAKRAGINEIILCEQNRKDIDDIKPEYIAGLTFTYVTYIREVIAAALEGAASCPPADVAHFGDAPLNIPDQATRANA